MSYMWAVSDQWHLMDMSLADAPTVATVVCVIARPLPYWYWTANGQNGKVEIAPASDGVPENYAARLYAQRALGIKQEQVIERTGV
jgi:hypothetical protein